MTAPLWWTACIDCRRQIGDDHEAICPQEGQVSRFDTCQFIPVHPRKETRNRNRAPDGPRYKALGNSMAVNVMNWIGERIAVVETLADEILAP